MSEGTPGPSPRAARIRGLCELAWQLPEAERMLFVRRSTADDGELAAAVLTLLRSAREGGVGAGRAAIRNWLKGSGDALEAGKDGALRSPASSEERSLGDFQILRPIDEGGTGVVWLAHQKSLGRQVALKTYRTRTSSSEAPRQQFLRAAQLAARLQHPHIVSTYTAGVEGDTLYYVMEYVEGVTLERLLRALKLFANEADESDLLRLPPGLLRAIWPDGDGPGGTDMTSSNRLRARPTLLRRVFSYIVEAFTPVVEAIEYAHRQGIVHGDLKPANLIVDGTGRMLVIDFGLARSVSLIESEGTGALAGTAQYMSPELVAGQTGPSRAVDIYALGATLYEVLALVPAYDGPTREAILARIATENPAPLREVNPRVHRDLGHVVERAMHRQPRRRYATAGIMAEDLRRFLRRQPLSSTGSSLAVLGQRVLHDHPMASVAAIVLLVAGAGFGAERGLAAISNLAASARADELWREIEAVVAEARARTATAGEAAGRVEASLEHANDVLLQAGGRGIPADAVASRRAWLAQQAADIRIRAYVAAGEPDLAHQFLQEAEREGVDTRALVADLLRSGALGGLDVATAKPAGVTVSLRRVNAASNETEDAIVRSAPAPAAFTALFPGDYVVEMAQAGALPIHFGVHVDAAMRTAVRVPYAPSDVPAGMVYVGCSDAMEFVSGDHDTQYEIGSYGPQRRRLYRSFFLDRLEVRNSDYARFCESPDREHWIRTALRTRAAAEAETSAESLLLTSPIGWTIGKPAEGTEEQPVRITNWRDAMAYALWRQAELPTELEWEFAARGIGSRVFPYGNHFVLANHYSIRLTDAGSHPRDASIHGVLDMLGSVPELVLGPAGSTEFALRGASHNEQNPHACRLARTLQLPAAEEGPTIVVALVKRVTACVPWLQSSFSLHSGVPFGFRCKRDAAGLDLHEEPMR